jgi:3'-phosphoadenosine 5'-phosphosulfate sulfotransferase (PAPS reductase)/FAD synthetase
MNRRRKSKSESSKLPDVVMTIEVPKALEGAVFVASVSGGKDSAAVVQALREAGIPFVAAFADTGWEAPATYEYLETMERVFGITIHRVRAEGGGMVEKIMARAGFPARKQRWCTRELKIQPLTEFCQRLAAEQGREVVQVLGIRKEESEKRSMALPVEHDDSRDLWVWRPILDWTVGDVLAAHHRAGLPVNPLYKQGHNRVGCWPCIYAGKEEIRLIAEQDPGRIAQIAQLERDCERLRAERNIEQPDRYAHEMASFFQARQAIRVKGRRVYLPMHIEQIVEWSRTDHGGKQHLLVREAPDGGCFRWGTCEPPPARARARAREQRGVWRGAGDGPRCSAGGRGRGVAGRL